MSDFENRRNDENSLLLPHGNSREVNTRIITLTIITLFIVMMVLTVLRIYTRCIFSHQASRQAALNGSGFIARIHSHETPKRGLELSVIASLPLHTYKEIDHGPDHLSHECTICLSAFEDGQIIRALPNCKHHFHVECIDNWLGSQSSCPICRQEVELGPSIPPLPREPSTRLGVGVGSLSAQPLESAFSVVIAIEGTSDEMVQAFEKADEKNSRTTSLISTDSARHSNSCAHRQK